MYHLPQSRHHLLPPHTFFIPTEPPRAAHPWKQYSSLSDKHKCKVETVLFLIDKFSVGDAFIHELSMAVNGMPKSYLIKQCQDKLNSTCLVKPTPGTEPGAQVSFKESLINKLRLLVSTWCVFLSVTLPKYT